MTKKIETDVTIRGDLTITGSVAATLFTGAVSIGTGGVTGPATLSIHSSLYTGGASGTSNSMAAFYSTETMARNVGAGIMLGGKYTGAVNYEFAEMLGVKGTSTPGSKRGNLVMKVSNGSGLLTEIVRVSESGISVGCTGGTALGGSAYEGVVTLNGERGGIIEFLKATSYLGEIRVSGFGTAPPDFSNMVFSGTGAVYSIKNDNDVCALQWSPDNLRMVFGASTATATSGAQWEMVSTTGGFKPPAMTTTERDAISSPPDGLMIYNDTTNKLNLYAASSWGPVDGVLYQNAADGTTTTGTAEQTLFTYTLPADSLVTDGDMVEVFYHLSVTTAAVTKQLQFYLGSNVMFTYTVASGTGCEPAVTIKILRQGATTCRASIQFLAVNAFGTFLGTPVSIFTTSTTWANSQVIKATVTHNGSSAGATTGRICQIKKYLG